MVAGAETGKGRAGVARGLTGTHRQRSGPEQGTVSSAGWPQASAAAGE